MANIAKIKSELKLDCFLQKADPRAALDGRPQCYNRNLTARQTSQIGLTRSFGLVIVRVLLAEGSSIDRRSRSQLPIGFIPPSRRMACRTEEYVIYVALMSVTHLASRVRPGLDVGSAESRNEKYRHKPLPRISRGANRLSSNIQIRRMDASFLPNRSLIAQLVAGMEVDQGYES